jgi:hypothetical protein
METINNCVSSCAGRYAVPQCPVEATQTQLAAISSSRSIDLDLVTEEGDKVTLSIDAKAFAMAASSGEVELDEDGIAAQWSGLRAGAVEREIQLTVEGELNRQERREIRKVLKTINKMMAQFVQGKLVPMMNKAKKLGGLETIDSLELSMSYERQFLVARQNQVSVAYDQYGQSASAPTVDEKPSPLQFAVEARSLARDMAKKVKTAAVSGERFLAMAKTSSRLTAAGHGACIQWGVGPWIISVNSSKRPLRKKSPPSLKGRCRPPP